VNNRYSAAAIIARRRELWEQTADIAQDSAFVSSVADYLVSEQGQSLRDEIHARPELLIELAFVIVDKQQQTVPFLLNDVQKDFLGQLNQAIEDREQGRRHHLAFIVLKGRQQGFTSVITALQLAYAITRKNFAGYTLADDSDNTETIFTRKAKFPYDSLPQKLRPSERYNNRRELMFHKLNSAWTVATAGKSGAGRSQTLNFFHGSEVAFWRGISDTLTALNPALTAGSISILESTANGYNEFKDLWDSGAYTNLFFEWWRTSEYRLEFESKQAEREFRYSLEHGAEWIWERCRWLAGQLDMAQVYWYYSQWRVFGDKIRQEYPCSADEAFLASGTPVFDVERIIQRKAVLQKQGKVWTEGYFAITWDDPATKGRILSYRWVEQDGGFIRIFEQPGERRPYVLGGDTKGEGSDFFAGRVIDNITGARVASLHGQMAADVYAHQMYCLGRYYNDALIGIETNFDTFPIVELQRLGYPHQYVRKVYDTYTGKHQDRFGFRTDGNTRPLIISKMVTILRDHIDLIPDTDLLDEALTFVYDKNMRPDAEEGKHDDLLFADMIAEEIRGQQSRQEQEDKPEKPKKLITELRKRNKRRRR
jgi:hypothetical protein